MSHIGKTHWKCAATSTSSEFLLFVCDCVDGNTLNGTFLLTMLSSTDVVKNVVQNVEILSEGLARHVFALNREVSCGYVGRLDVYVIQ